MKCVALMKWETQNKISGGGGGCIANTDLDIREFIHRIKHD